MTARRSWTQEEVNFLIENPRMSHAAAARLLDRTPMAVQSYRYWLRKRDVPVGQMKGSDQRTYIGKRTVLAKTCTTCGLLLEAEWFSLQRDGRRKSRCRTCRGTVGRENRTDRWDMQRQAETAEQATRSWSEWTETELRVIERDDLTAYDAALLLGRTLAAVSQARRIYGLEPRTRPLPEPVEKWAIRRVS